MGLQAEPLVLYESPRWRSSTVSVSRYEDRGFGPNRGGCTLEPGEQIVRTPRVKFRCTSMRHRLVEMDRCHPRRLDYGFGYPKAPRAGGKKTIPRRCPPQFNVSRLLRWRNFLSRSSASAFPSGGSGCHPSVPSLRAVRHGSPKHPDGIRAQGHKRAGRIGGVQGRRKKAISSGGEKILLVEKILAEVFRLLRGHKHHVATVAKNFKENKY